MVRDTTFAGCVRFCITPARYAVTLDRPFIAPISGTCDAVRGNRHHGHIASPFREPLMSATLYNWLESGLTGWGLGAIALYFLLVTQLTIFAVTLYLHRSQAHRGVDFHPVLAHFFRFWTWLSTSMITREWAAIHRKNHAPFDTAQDSSEECRVRKKRVRTCR